MYVLDQINVLICKPASKKGRDWDLRLGEKKSSWGARRGSGGMLVK